MYQAYDTAVSKVMASPSSESQRKAIRHYFALLKGYLIDNALPYSHQAALDWLSKNEQIWTRRKFLCCRTSVYKLNDVMAKGEVVSVRHYPYDNAPKYVKLSSWSRELLDSPLNEVVYRGSGKNNFRIAVAEYLWFLERCNVRSSDEISFRFFAEYLNFVETAHRNEGVRKDYVRRVREFLSMMSDSEAFRVLIKNKVVSNHHCFLRTCLKSKGICSFR